MPEAHFSLVFLKNLDKKIGSVGAIIPHPKYVAGINNIPGNWTPWPLA
jgi:hypothetical protein